MGKKKRSKSEPSVTEDGEKMNCTVSFTKDSQSSGVMESQPELIRVSMYLQASLMERYLWAIEERRKEIVQMYSNETAEVWLNRDEMGDPMEKCQQLQIKMNQNLEQVHRQRQHAEKLFKENLDRIESGESIFNLKLVDQHVPYSKMDEFIAEYRNKQLEGSTYSSLSSQDSACHTDEDISGNHGSTLNLSSYYQWDRACSPSLCSPEYKDLTSGANNDGIMFMPSSEDCLNAAERHRRTQHDEPSKLEDDDEAIIQAVVYCKSSEKGTTTKVAESELQPFDFDGFLGTPQYDIPDAVESDNEDEKLQSAYFSTDDDDEDENRFEAPAIRPRTRQISLRSEPDRITDDILELRLEGQPSFLDHLPALNELSRIWSSYDSIADNSPRPGSQASVGSQQNGSASAQEMQQAKETKAVDGEQAKKKPKAVSMSSFSNQKEKSADGLSFFWKPSSDNGSVNGRAETPKKATAAPRSNAPTKAAESKPEQNGSSRTVPEGYIAYSTKLSRRKFPADSTLNKTSICWAFESKGQCPWGDECIFAHGRKELKLIPPGYKKPDFKTTKQKLEAVIPHPEPCDQQLCAAKLQFLLYKTTICKLWEGRGCNMIKDKCKFAHGLKDLRPLPKYELCERFKQNRCPNKTTECVYAHFKNELRKPPANMTATAKPALSAVTADKSGPRKPAPSVPVSNALSYASAAIGAGRRRTVSEGSPLSAVVESEETEEEECILCSNLLTAGTKYALNCGHNAFHMKCITQWINNGDPTCPLCRNKEEIIATDDGWTKVTSKNSKR